jgi:hypothetical protein
VFLASEMCELDGSSERVTYQEFEGQDEREGKKGVGMGQT